MKAFVLAGGLPQIALIQELKSRGYFTILADGGAEPLAKPYADRFYQLNIFDIEAVKAIAIEENVDFIITCCADQVLLVVAQVAELLNLPWYIDYDTAQKVSDKELMKRVFMENDIPTSHYVVMDELDMNKIQPLKFPLIVKPVDAYSSRGVRKVLNSIELKTAFEEAAQISRNKNVIVEEFCLGEEISVDIFVEDGKAQLLCVSNSEKVRDADRFVIFRGKYPACASPELLRKIEMVAQKIADAFQIKNAPMLIQMITDGENLYVLEFCARTGGAMKYLLIRHSCGVDVIKAVVDLTLGVKPNIKTLPPKKKYIVNDFIYCKEGTFDHLEGFKELVDRGILADYHELRPKGFRCSGNVNSSGDRVAGFTVMADSIEEFNDLHNIIVDSVKVIDTEGHDIMRHDLLPGLSS